MAVGHARKESQMTGDHVINSKSLVGAGKSPRFSANLCNNSGVNYKNSQQILPCLPNTFRNTSGAFSNDLNLTLSANSRSKQ